MSGFFSFNRPEVGDFFVYRNSCKGLCAPILISEDSLPLCSLKTYVCLKTVFVCFLFIVILRKAF